MRVIQLDGYLFGEGSPLGVARAEAADDVCERAGYQEVLLHEPQPLPHAGGIVRIQHPCEGLGFQPLRHGANEFTVTECLKVETVRCGRFPQSKSVDGLAAVAHYGPVIRDTEEAGRTILDDVQ